MKRSTVLSALCWALIPVTVWMGTVLPGRSYYLTGTLVVLQTMLPFFLLFEARKPRARELVTIAVLCALAAVSRVAFVFPHFKPTTAIIMLAGIAFGPQAGFMTGAVSALASNLFYSQGPWTPWQMMAYGFGGFLAGLCFHKRGERRPLLLAAFGFAAILLAVGPILDLCTLFTMTTQVTAATALAVFAAGFPTNLTHAAACALTLFLFSKPLLNKLTRLKTKYGMLEGDTQ